VIAFLACLSNPLVWIGCTSRLALTFRNLAISIARCVLININPFALKLARVVSVTLYLFFNTIQGTMKCLPLTSRLKLIFKKLITYPRQESCPRVLLFPIPPLPLSSTRYTTRPQSP
jgi:hypothetical protein